MEIGVFRGGWAWCTKGIYFHASWPGCQFAAPLASADLSLLLDRRVYPWLEPMAWG